MKNPNCENNHVKSSAISQWAISYPGSSGVYMRFLSFHWPFAEPARVTALGTGHGAGHGPL